MAYPQKLVPEQGSPRLESKSVGRLVSRGTEFPKGWISIAQFQLCGQLRQICGYPCEIVVYVIYQNYGITEMMTGHLES